jgi:hypothetical protein
MNYPLVRNLTTALTSVLCVCALAPFTAAETLPVAGVYPAANDAAASVTSIAIENFGGDEGASLSFAITDALDSAIIHGAPYFTLLPANDGDVDAILRGSANVEAVEIELDDRKVVKCKKKDADKKCIKEKVTFYECTRLEVSLHPRVRLIGTDGREIYRKRDTLSASDDFCANDHSIPSIEGMLDGLVNSFANRVRYDLAPVYRNQQIRVLEGRKGMGRNSKKEFRNAVKLTKTNLAAACDEFDALEATYPQHPSVLFNIGLCAEGIDDLDKAEAYYQRTLSIESGKDYPSDGLRRIADRRRAAAQLNSQFGPIQPDMVEDEAQPADAQ